MLLLILDEHARAQKFFAHFNFLLPNHGLSETTNNFLYRDTRGFLWISSMDGPNRFDGKAVRVYRSDSTGIGNNVQSEFFEDSEGNLWFSVYEAVVCYDLKKDALRYFQYGNIKEDYYVVALDSAMGLWVRLGGASNGQMYRFDLVGKSWSEVCPAGEFRIATEFSAKGQVLCFYAFSSAKKGLTRIRRETSGQWTAVRLLEGEFAIESVLWQSNKVLWLCTDRGLVRLSDPLHNISSQCFPLPDAAAARSACLDDGGDLLVAASNQTIWRYKPSEGLYQKLLEGNDPHSGLLARGLGRIYKDQEGNIWLTHPAVGLSFTNVYARKVGIFDLAEALKVPKNSIKIASLAKCDKGGFYALAKGYGVVHLTNDFTVSTIKRDAQSFFSAICCDRNNNLWVGCANKILVKRSGEAFFKEVVCPSRPDFFVNQFLEDKKGQLLVAADSGIWVASANKQGYMLERLADFEGLARTYIPWCSQDNQGQYYFDKNYASLGVWPLGERPRDFATGHIVASTEDPDSPDTLWLASDRGLYCLDKKKWQLTLLGTKEGVPREQFYSILRGPQGYLWLSANRGLVRYDPIQKRSLFLTQSDGILETGFRENHALVASDGRLLFATGSILYVINPDKLNPINIKPKIELTAIKLNDEPYPSVENVGLMKHLACPYSSTLSFDFVALDFSDPSEVRLRYRLDGYDAPGQWVDAAAGSTGFARYAQLAPGHYQLQIMAANSDGVWNPTPKTLDISIAPPFWQTWWFGALMAAAIAGLLYALFQARLRRERQKQQLALERAEQARRAAQLEADNAKLATAVAEQERANTEIRLQTLRLQMNPHFIFNSLNSINSFILRRQPEQASNYLDDFAQLMRWTLDSSDREMVSLQEELDMLGRFVGLEARRLPFPLRWEYSVAETLDPWDIEVPALLLQPFLENAIWHGLLPKQGEGFLHLTIEQKGDLLVCCITDNGVGRAAASRSRPTGHVSKAENITRKRLEAHDQRCGQAGISSLSIEDLFHADGVPAGTKVILALQICRD